MALRCWPPPLGGGPKGSCSVGSGTLHRLLFVRIGTQQGQTESLFELGRAASREVQFREMQSAIGRLWPRPTGS